MVSPALKLTLGLAEVEADMAASGSNSRSPLVVTIIKSTSTASTEAISLAAMGRTKLTLPSASVLGLTALTDRASVAPASSGTVPSTFATGASLGKSEGAVVEGVMEGVVATVISSKNQNQAINVKTILPLGRLWGKVLGQRGDGLRHALRELVLASAVFLDLQLYPVDQ